MMSTTAAILQAGDEKQSCIKSEGDEEVIGMSLEETADPAILARGPGRAAPRLTYTRERLLEIRQLPLSKARPRFLDACKSLAHSLAPVSSQPQTKQQRPETPADEMTNSAVSSMSTSSSSGPGTRGGDIPPDSHAKRRSCDPRERLRKEQDGIVLSPQRRSFNLGCSAPQVPGASSVAAPVVGPRGARPESPKATDLIPAPQLPARRIGSGRIVTRDIPWDYKGESGQSDGQEYGFRSSNQLQQNVRRDVDRDERYERRSFGRDFDRDKDQRDKDRHPAVRNGRYSGDRRRMMNDNKDDEPEWFSGGPTSQSDTIELRGFEDIPEERNIRNGNKKTTALQKKKGKDKEQRKLSIEGQDNIANEESSPMKGPGARSTPTRDENREAQQMTSSSLKENSNVTETITSHSDISDKATEIAISKIDDNNKNLDSQTGFNFEDLLKMDTISGLLSNGVDSAGSRFSRWFTRESPPPQPDQRQSDSRRSSLQDELLNNIIKDITEPTTVSIPNASNDSDAYFTPISPAAGNMMSGAGPICPPQSNAIPDKPFTLMEMLQSANNKVKQSAACEMPPFKNFAEVPGKFVSLEEIEANLRTNLESSSSGLTGAPAQNMNVHKADEDMSAFKRLLEQVSGGHAVPVTNGPIPQKQQQPMSLLQMLSKSQQQDEMIARNANFPPQISPELVMKLHQVQQSQRQQQQQQEMMAKLMQGNMGGRPYQASPLPTDPLLHTALPAHNADLLQRPEAQAIIQGLKRGEITLQHLMQQLANPAIQPRHRDMISSIVKMHTNSRAVSPAAHPDLLQQLLFQQQQQLRVSPLPPNAMPQRIPSPRELQAHTQSIMQQALIKKKLEEQRENYRKKQESMQQRSMSPATGSSGNNSSPAKHVSASPTPHAFTPTSVLRKMTATKEPESSNTPKDKLQISSENKQMQQQQQSQQNQPLPQGRPVIGMRQTQPSQQQQQQQSQMQHNWLGPTGSVKQQGRPILKGNNFQQQLPPQQQYSNASGMDYRNMAHMQSGGGNGGSMFTQMHRGNKVNSSYMSQQPSRSGIGGMSSANNNNAAAMRAHQLQLQMAQMQQRTGMNPTLHQLLQFQGSGYESRGIPMAGRGGLSPQSGELSPTSNQLARWFSPELLAQARAGKLPDMPPVSLAQNARSLEELERMQQASATAVHN